MDYCAQEDPKAFIKVEDNKDEVHHSKSNGNRPLGMELTPANDVLLYLFPGGLGPRHLAGECAHESRVVSLDDSTMSEFQVWHLRRGIGL